MMNAQPSRPATGGTEVATAHQVRHVSVQSQAEPARLGKARIATAVYLTTGGVVLALMGLLGTTL